MLQQHQRTPVSQSPITTECPEHHQPVVAVCKHDRALLCTSCLLSDAPHEGHSAVAVEHATTLLQQHLGELLDSLMARCRNMAAAPVQWKGQAALAEALSEMQCAFVKAEGR